MTQAVAAGPFSRPVEPPLRALGSLRSEGTQGAEAGAGQLEGPKEKAAKGHGEAGVLLPQKAACVRAAA